MQKIGALQSEAEQKKKQAYKFKTRYQQLLSWVEIFDSAMVEENDFLLHDQGRHSQPRL